MGSLSPDANAELWRRAYAIFDRALECPVEDREPFARREAQGDVLPIVLELIRNASLEEAPTASEARGPGHRIGRYEITGTLGRGGMGQVYAARDTELGREVALKLLSAAGSSDQLIREAKAASALNHPNIVTVHDVVRQGPEIAIAMELVEGRPLRSYCGQTQPVETVMQWGRQIAQALSATHGRGIVHRDIKPENVMVRPDGYVKVLDFGLARRDRLAGGASSTQSSLFGKLGGTLTYMSPEQTRGETPKAPSDVFSLGVVLYELACGRHPFPSASPIDTAYAIAHHRPKRDPALPEEFADLLEAMLEKKPEARPAAGEVAVALTAPEGIVSESGNRKRNWWPQGVAVAVAIGLVGMAVSWWWSKPTTSAGPMLRYSIPVESGKAPATELAISPRGDELVFQTVDGLFRQALLGNGKYGPARLIPGSENGASPFYSPDGQQVGYFVNGKIQAATQSGYRVIGETPTARTHATWGQDGFIYFTGVNHETPTIARLPARGGGQKEWLLASGPTARGFAFRLGQQWQPDGLVYSVLFGPVSRSVEWLSFSSGETRRIVERGMGGRVLQSGHLLYYWQGSLFAAPYNQRSHVMTGPAAAVLDDVEQAGWFGPAAAVSDTGTLVYTTKPPLAKLQLYWVTPGGGETALPIAPDTFEQVDVSPDGRRLATVRFNAQRHWVLSLYDMRSNTMTTLLETPFERLRAIWSPDSKSLVVAKVAEGYEFTNLFVIPVEAPDRAERLTDQPEFGQYPSSWSAAAQAILYVEGTHPKSESDVMLYSLRTGKSKLMVAGPQADRSPTFSPDGQWFSYSSDAEGAVFVQDLAQSTTARRVGPGSSPQWSPKGDRIYYLARGGALMMATVDKAGNTGMPRQLTEGGIITIAGDYWTRPYSVGADGRILVMRSVPESASPRRAEIHVIENWFPELKRLAPIP